ncbi:MAG: hypothetical protein IJT08_03990 [Alphaproteobacteria bacterium]|nr:hypothetical protein [Alphaproteobacteria bacterium]
MLLLIYKIGSSLLLASGIISLLFNVIPLIKKRCKQPTQNKLIASLSFLSLLIIILLSQYTDVPEVKGMSCDNAKQWLANKGLNAICINQEDMQLESDLSMPVKAQSRNNCIAKKGSDIILYTRQKTKEIVNKSYGNLYENTSSQYYTPGKQYHVGDSFLFGSFEQDGIISNGKELIEWTVISIEDSRMLVITKYGLAYMKYQADDSGPTWEKSSLRKWLNSSFYKSAFTSEEVDYILDTENTNMANPSYFTDGGTSTIDSLFCLSVYEVIKYFETDSDRVAIPTKYAIDTFVGATIHTDGDYWWLRTPGNTETEVMDVRGNGSNSGRAGSVNFYGSHSFGDEVMVRPAMWILFDSFDNA